MSPRDDHVTCSSRTACAWRHRRHATTSHQAPVSQLQPITAPNSSQINTIQPLPWHRSSSSTTTFPIPISELWVEVLRPGRSGCSSPSTNDVVEVHYSCLLARSGRVVDTSRNAEASRRRSTSTKSRSNVPSEPYRVVLGTQQVVLGMEKGLNELTLGAVARLHVPSALGYGAAGNDKSVPPHADLVFEVELLAVNDQRVKGLRVPEVRKLMTLPVLERAHVPRSGGISWHYDAAVISAALEAAKSERAQRAAIIAAGGVDGSNHNISCESDGEEAEAAEAAADAEEAVETAAVLGTSAAVPASTSNNPPPPSPPRLLERWPWVDRLRPPLAPPLDESASFFATMHAFKQRYGSRGWARAIRGHAPSNAWDGGSSSGGDDDGARWLLPTSLSIRRAPYGTKFDSRTPMVLTGERRNWPCFRWGWRYWSAAHGEDMATAKQRAPIFDSDQWEDTVVAEAAFHEYIDYCRSCHRQPWEAQQRTALMYMNGIEIFSLHPQRWDFAYDTLEGANGEASIDNRTASEVRGMLESLGQDASEAEVAPSVSQYVKLFMGPRGAVTRMHQDNHHAHAWLSQVRGQKLYVLCAPQDYKLVAPSGASADQGGTTREGRLDPLDAAQRSEREAAGLRMYATILQPGETIVAPDSWWHYAVSLSPTITIMANFWDARNRKGLTDMMCIGMKPAAHEAPLSSSTSGGGGGGGSVRMCPTAAASVVVLREEPRAEAPVAGALRNGESSHFDRECDGWLRAIDIASGAKLGWAKARLESGEEALRVGARGNYFS